MSQVEITKSFKPFSGVTAKEATAKTLATKATKSTGMEYRAVEVEGGWSIEKVVKAAPKAQRSRKAKKEVQDWFSRFCGMVAARGMVGKRVELREGKRTKLVVEGKTLTWFVRKEDAERALTAFAA